MSSESESELDGVPSKRKKGVSNEAKYKRNVIKTAKVKGQAYTSYSGKHVDQRVQECFNCRCAVKCYAKLTDETKSDIWNNFYSFENKNVQDTYLQGLIEKRQAKRRRSKKKDLDLSEDDDQMATDDEKVSRPTKMKTNFFTYYLKIDGELQVVCKNTFMKVHDITAKRVRRLCMLLVAGKSPVDLRGKMRSCNAIKGEVCIKIHEHISKFEAKKTHYGGKPKEYLDARLNVKIMHNMFLESYPECNSVTYSFYRKYFLENFSLTFGRPQVDVCSTCERFSSKMRDQSLSDNTKRGVAAEQIIHKRRAKKFYTALKDASVNKDDDTVAIAFDYMQNQPLPHIPVQEVFYLRQLWVNIFCIHNLKTNDANLYLYHEGQAHKSPDEVCSFLLKYIQTLPNTVKKLLVFSDGTGGQNKNHAVTRFLLSLCDTGRFESITHYFPVRGHSFMPCDRDFGSIKRVMRKTDRIFTIDQYGELFKRSSTRDRFTICHIQTDDILSFKSWWPTYYKKLVISDETSGRGIRREDRIAFKISSFRQFNYDSTKKGKIVAAEHIGGLITNTFSLAKTDNQPILPSRKAYPESRVPINHKKIADLNKLTPYLCGYEDFYNQILSWPTTASENHDDSERENPE